MTLTFQKAHLIGKLLVSNDQVPYAISLRQRASWPEHLEFTAIGHDSVDDDRGIPKDAEEEIVVLVVKAFDVGVD